MGAYSKSVLRAACGEIYKQRQGIIYFPVYEIVTGPQASEIFFEPNRRKVSKEGTDTVMQSFLAYCENYGIRNRNKSGQQCKGVAFGIPHYFLSDLLKYRVEHRFA